VNVSGLGKTPETILNMKHTQFVGRLPTPLAAAAGGKFASVLLLACLLPSRIAFSQQADTESRTSEKEAETAVGTAVETIPSEDRLAELTRELSTERAAREASEKRIVAEVAEIEARADARAQARISEALSLKPWAGENRGLSFSGFLQAELWFRQSSEDQLNESTLAPLNQDRFLLRRGRLRGTYERDYVSAALELDANTVNGNQVRVVGAETSLRWPGGAAQPLAQLTVGLFKIPFGIEVLQSDCDRLFLERSTVVHALFPGEFDLGARVQGAWRFLRYAVAIQNGEPLGESSYPALDPNHAKDIVGRVGVDTPLGAFARWLAGISAVYGRGFHKGTSATKATTVWQDRNENGSYDTGELIAVPGIAATPSANFSRFGLGIDARVSFRMPRLGETVLYGEVMWAKNLDRAVLVADPLGSLGRDLREMGYYVAAVQDVGRYLQLGVRYDFYDPDRDATDLQGATLVLSSQSYRTMAMAVAVRYGAGRLVFEYDVNRNHSGRTSTGLPTNLADNLFAVRSEVRF
jgi:hypothetical protein